jgi:threonyl-tRNA synthetase
VVGDKEVAEQTVAIRSRVGGDQGAQSVDAFIEAAKNEVAEKGRQEALTVGL